jgi:zinc/manganese transport system permease protein
MTTTGIPFFDYAFMARAGAGMVALAFGAAPLGVFLMQRRMSLAGDAMAHAILPGAALGYWISGLSLASMTIGGFIAGISVALLSGLTARTTLLKEDASLAAFYLISLGLGVLLISLKGNNVDLLAILFGNILALDDATLLFIGGTTTLTLIVLSFLLRPLALDSFDRSFLRSVSAWSTPAHLLFMVLITLNLVAGFQAMGTLLAVALMILPAACARLWTQSLGAMLGFAVLCALGGGLSGLMLAYVLPVAPSAAIVLVLGVLYFISLVFGTHGSIAQNYTRTVHKEA